MRKTSIFTIGLYCLMQTSFAAETSNTAEAELDGTEGSISFGLTGSKGNSDIVSATGSAELQLMRQQWFHNLEAEFEYGKIDGEVDTELFEGHYSLGYILGSGKYLFNLTSYQTDKPRGTQWRFSNVGGYGVGLLEGDNYSVDGMFGAGFRKTRYTQDSGADELRIGEGIGHIGLMSELKLTETTKLSHSLVLQPGKENNYGEMSTTLSVAMTETISLNVKHSFKHNSNPPESLKKNDSMLGINISVEF